jgi:hypothetical protein
MDKSYKIVRYKTDYKPKVILLSIQVLKVPFTLEIAVYDQKRPNTSFYVRKEDFTEKEIADYEINLPLTNDEMTLGIFTRDSNLDINKYIKINRLEIKDLHLTPLNLPEEQQSFIKFLKQFSLQAGYLPSNYKFKSDDGKYEIRYLPHIESENGGVHVTPARIHTRENYIEVSKLHFERKPVARRLAILLHEMSHNYVNQDPNSEEEADLNAARLYLAMGFPKSEFMYAFSKTFKTYSDEQFDKLVSNPDWFRNYKINVDRLAKTYDFLNKN